MLAGVQPGNTKKKKGSATMAKIRDSCHSCALSKVRCPKEKPICSRCEKRGISCEYFVMKRPGRKRDKGSDRSKMGTCNESGTKPSNATDTQPGGVLSRTVSSSLSDVSSSSIPASPLPEAAASSGHFNCFIDGFTDVNSLLELLEVPKDSELNNLFADLPSQPFDIEADMLNLDTCAMLKEQCHHADLLTPYHMDLDANNSEILTIGATPLSLSSTARPHQVQMPSGAHTGIFSELGMPTACRCMALATCLSQKLFSPESLSSDSGSSSSSNSGFGSAHGSHGSCLLIPEVLQQNKETIDTVSNILQCSCAETGYLTTMLSMIVFKVLELYTGAIRQVHGGSASLENALGWTRSVTGEFNTQFEMLHSKSSSKEGDRRRAAQLILGELHHVQYALNQLALRLRARGAGNALEQGLSLRPESSTSLLSHHSPHTETFSTDTLGQMEADLRRGLTSLSSEIIAGLLSS